RAHRGALRRARGDNRPFGARSARRNGLWASARLSTSSGKSRRCWNPAARRRRFADCIPAAPSGANALRLDMATSKTNSFVGKRVVLTGAASGIGRACALELARRGAWLALVDVDARGLQATLRDVRALGASASAIVADLSGAEAAEAAMREALAA